MSIRTASRQEETFLPLIEGDENADVIIGTHALLYEKVSFANLGLVVIDEQHKFGVAQRARLTSREPAPDVLVMTATPIPRTITMTVYGDLDVSILDEMPRGRGKIITAVRDSSKLGEVLSFLRKQLEASRQLYVVYPLIERARNSKRKRPRSSTNVGGSVCIHTLANCCTDESPDRKSSKSWNDFAAAKPKR